MKRKHIIALRIVIAMVIATSLASTAFSWTWMSTTGAIIMTALGSITVIGYVGLAIGLEKLLKEVSK